MGKGIKPFFSKSWSWAAGLGARNLPRGLVDPLAAVSSGQAVGHRGWPMAFTFLAFPGTFFLCKIDQAAKLLKENEIFNRHALFS